MENDIEGLLKEGNFMGGMIVCVLMAKEGMLSSGIDMKGFVTEGIFMGIFPRPILMGEMLTGRNVTELKSKLRAAVDETKKANAFRSANVEISAFVILAENN